MISPVFTREAQFCQAERLAKQKLKGRIWTLEHTGKQVLVSTEWECMTLDVSSSYGGTLGSDSWSLHETSIECLPQRAIETAVSGSPNGLASRWRNRLWDLLEPAPQTQGAGEISGTADARAGHTSSEVLTTGSFLYIENQRDGADVRAAGAGTEFRIHHNKGVLDFKITIANVIYWTKRKLCLQSGPNSSCKLRRHRRADAPLWHADRARAAWIICE